MISLVFGKTREEHYFNLRAALQRALDKGIRLNEEKLEVGLVEIGYVGHVLSADGLRPDPMKIWRSRTCCLQKIGQNLKLGLEW